MRLKIEHTTIFEYDEPVSEAYTEVRLKPQEESGQHCLSFTLSVDPRCEVFQYVDYRGNDVRNFDILPAHERLTVKAASQVVTSKEFMDRYRELTLMERFDYLQPTLYTLLPDVLGKLFLQPASPDDKYQFALEIMHAVHHAIQYEKGATDVSTTAERALALGRGVCQDYTHVMLAACRAIDLPARYVSGYLYSPTSHESAHATHAWVDIYLDGRGWVSLDPTHDIPQSEHHVRVAVGRDYSDVTPTRGLYTGTAKEALNVKVRIRPG
jgi:transglutaminase-like putative cysteine protease